VNSERMKHPWRGVSRLQAGQGPSHRQHLSCSATTGGRRRLPFRLAHAMPCLSRHSE
jgi:hypothetical protein